MKSPLVQRTVERLREEIQGGDFSVDQPLPTHRQWADRLRVSRFTVSRALHVLQEEGVVESAEGSYTFLRDSSLRPRPPAVPVAMSRSTAKTPVVLWPQESSHPRKIAHALMRREFQQQFAARFPSIEIQEEPRRWPPGDLEAHLFQSLIRGEGPTLMHMKQTNLPFLRKHGLIAPIWTAREGKPRGRLSRSYRNGEKQTDEVARNYVEGLEPRIREACQSEVAGGGRQALWILPTSVTCSFLTWNRAIFRDAGLSAEQFPQGIDELEDVFRRLSVHLNGHAVFHIAGVTEVVWLLQQLVHQMGPAPENGRLLPVNWYHDASRAALELFRRWYFVHRWIEVHQEAGTGFMGSCLAGRVPVTMDPHLVIHLAVHGGTDAFGIAPFPWNANGRIISQLNCVGWAVNAQAPPESREAGIRYLVEWERWIHGAEGARRMRQAGVTPALHPLFRELGKDQFVVQHVPDAWRNTLEVLRAQAFWEPASADWNRVVLARALVPILQRKDPPTVDELRQTLILAELEAGLDLPDVDAGAIEVQSERVLVS